MTPETLSTILLGVGSVLSAFIVAVLFYWRGENRGYKAGRAYGKAETNLEWSTARLNESVAAMERLEKYLRSKAPDGDEIKLSETVTRADLVAAKQDLQSLTPRRDWDPTAKSRWVLDRLLEQAAKDQEP